MLNRRDLLIGLLASGTLAATATPSFATTARTVEATHGLEATHGFEARPLRLLVAGRGEDADFIAGARAVAGAQVDVVRLSAALSELPAELQRVLAQSRSMRVGALLDEADSIVLEACAVASGARILAAGTHARDGARSSRHAIRPSNCAADLAQALAASDLAPTVASGRVSAARIPWAASLGETFATIAAGTRHAGPLDRALSTRREIPAVKRSPSAHSASLLLEA
jgi:hypothetical protein